MTSLKESIFIEKYRPQTFDNLILEDKSTILKYMDNPKSIPSFIFYSNKPGTGKTSTARIIINLLQCDALFINSSDDRGIDTIREQVKIFARSLSTNDNIKRCVFLDEADGLTRQAQDSLRNLMEEYSDNCFFIFTANDYGKIIEPLRSRCIAVNFERPNKVDIEERLNYICNEEKISADTEALVDFYYPDIRKMVNILQECKVSGKDWARKDEEFSEFLKIIQSKDVKAIYNKVYAGDFDLVGFNKWFFREIFNLNLSLDKTSKIASLLADTEKNWNLNCNLEVIFLANILEIVKIL